MIEEDHALEVFFDVQRGLPRQGPGDDGSTSRALRACRDLPRNPGVLDVGCGPGMQTLALARALDCFVVAVDLHREYLDDLQASAAASGLIARVAPVLADMRRLPFAVGSFDLIWAESSAYIMGVAQALQGWKAFLRPGGYIGLSELVWTSESPPAVVRDYFADAYPAMRDQQTIAQRFAACGFELLEQFTLPESAWWQHYYTPLEKKLPTLKRKYRGDATAQNCIAMTETEIEMRRRFAVDYAYAFYVGRLGLAGRV